MPRLYHLPPTLNTVVLYSSWKSWWKFWKSKCIPGCYIDQLDLYICWAGLVGCWKVESSKQTQIWCGRLHSIGVSGTNGGAHKPAPGHADSDLKIFAKPKPQSLSSPALNGKRQDLEEKFKSELRKSQLWGWFWVHFCSPGPDIFSIYIGGVWPPRLWENLLQCGDLGRAEGKHTSQMEQPSAIIMGPQQPGK